MIDRSTLIVDSLLQINHLFHMVLYVSKNEETSYLKIIHIYEPERGVPSELEANAKSMSPMYPTILPLCADSLSSS